MRAYILRRILISIPLVFLMTFVVFAVINMSPQSAIDQFVFDPKIPAQLVEQEKERTGYYDSLPVRYLKWVCGVFGDIRLGRQDRVLLRFQSPDKFAQSYQPSCSVEPAWKPQTLSAESLELDLGAKTPGFADFADQIVRINLDLQAQGPASATLVISAQTQDNAPGTFAKTFELKADPKKPGAPFELKAEVTRAELLAADLNPETVRSAVLTHTGGGAVTVAHLSYSLEPYHFPRVGADDAKDGGDETRRQRTRPYMVVDLRAPGSTLRFDRLESPYAARYIGAGDWLPMTPMTTTNEAGRSVETPKVLNYDEESKEPIAPDFRFRSLRWRFTNRSDRDAEFTLAILSGEKEPFTETAVPLSIPARSRKNIDVPLSQLAEEGADLAHVQALELRARSAAKVAVDRVSLVLDQAPVAIKGIPNFGLSYRDKRPVLTKIFSAVRNTILLLVAAMLMTWLVALPAGVIAAVRQYKLSDKVLSLFSFVGMAVPGFFLAVVVRLIVQTLNDGDPAWWPGLPTSGRTSPDYDSFTAFGQFVDLVKHALLPVCVLSLGGMAGLQRVMRGTMLETKQQPFITTARAKGLPERVVIFKHALRIAITPFVAGFGSFFPALLGGSALIEIVFNYPGVGRLMLPAVLARDLNMIMANTLMAALLLVFGNLVADILLAIVDPRVSYE